MSHPCLFGSQEYEVHIFGSGNDNFLAYDFLVLQLLYNFLELEMTILTHMNKSKFISL